MASPAEQLTEARDAYHRLQIGESAVRFTDQNGETLEYTRASAPRLAAYIRDLERQIAGQTSPAKLHFRTSKGI